LPREVAEVIEKDILPHIPEKHKKDFFQFSLPAILKHKLSPEHWKAIVQIASHIPEEDKWYFFISGLPATLWHKLTPEHLQIIAQITPHVPKQHSQRFFEYSLPGVLKRKLTIEQLNQQAELAKHYVTKLGGTFYAGKVVTENFGKLAPPNQTVNRLTFDKTDSVLIPLGGRLTGHLIRIVTKKAFEAWQKAHDAGIPVEPITRSYEIKNGDYKGMVRVYTKAIGEVLPEYLKQNPHHEDELEKQRQGILTQLKNHGIEHGHAHHDHNFTVTMEKGKPQLHLIDWDRAESK